MGCSPLCESRMIRAERVSSTGSTNALTSPIVLPTPSPRDERKTAEIALPIWSEKAGRSGVACSNDRVAMSCATSTIDCDAPGESSSRNAPSLTTASVEATSSSVAGALSAMRCVALLKNVNCFLRSATRCCKRTAFPSLCASSLPLTSKFKMRATLPIARSTASGALAASAIAVSSAPFD